MKFGILINEGPFTHQSSDSAYRFAVAVAGSSILLIEDGVYAAMENAAHAEKISGRMDDFSFYVLGPDIAARGLDETPLIGGLTMAYECNGAMIEADEEGYITDSNLWNPELAGIIAASENIEMDDDHWVLKRATVNSFTSYSLMVRSSRPQKLPVCPNRRAVSNPKKGSCTPYNAMLP
jgi:tRNA 2-thiouridine synthesizing protein B